MDNLTGSIAPPAFNERSAFDKAYDPPIETQIAFEKYITGDAAGWKNG